MARYSIIFGNIMVVGVVGAIVATHFQETTSSSVITNNQSRLSSLVSTQSSSNATATAVNPLDEQSSVDIALSVAQATNMPERIAVVNQADSFDTNFAVAALESSNVTNKPLIVATNFKSNKDIKVYITKEGDTISSIAAAFGVTSDSIRWSNDLTGDFVAAGKTLYIPPINGVVYVVKSADTPSSLAAKYSSAADQIIAYNDAEITGLRVGERVLIPNGRAQIPVNAYISGGSYGFAASYGGNGYIYGYCTYYAASRVSIPTNWGNANTWDDRALMTPGWIVSSRPVVGAIAQTDRMSYWGHVAIVEAVSEDGSMIKFSDMNNLAGFGRVGYSNWVSTSTYENYIYRP